jgi:hypothetical protein
MQHKGQKVICSTSTRAPELSHQESAAMDKGKDHVCQQCMQSFASRNKLFCHLQYGDENCSGQSGFTASRTKAVQTQRVILQFGSLALNSARGGEGSTATVLAAIVQAQKASVGRSAQASERQSKGIAAQAPPQQLSRSGNELPAVCDTVCFVEEKMDAKRSAVFVEKMRSCLPPEVRFERHPCQPRHRVATDPCSHAPTRAVTHARPPVAALACWCFAMQVRLLSRMPVPQAFHATESCEWWRYECLVPVSVLWPAAGSMGPLFGFNNYNFRPMSQKKSVASAKGKQCLCDPPVLKTVPAPGPGRPVPARTQQPGPLPGAAEAALPLPPPDHTRQKEKALFAGLKKALKAFTGEHNFNTLLGGPQTQCPTQCAATRCSAGGGSAGGGSAGGGSADSSRGGGSCYCRVLHCYCRGIISDAPARDPRDDCASAGAANVPADGAGVSGDEQGQEYACISICTEAACPVRVLQALVGLAVGVARGASAAPLARSKRCAALDLDLRPVPGRRFPCGVHQPVPESGHGSRQSNGCCVHAHPTHPCELSLHGGM